VGVIAALLLAACSEMSVLPPGADVGPQPVLAQPVTRLIPTLHIAPAIGWPSGRTPVAAEGLQVRALATDLSHPRWLTVLPNGDVLVAETNAPARPDDGKGIKGWIMRLVQGRAGAGPPSANRITLLRDAAGDGQPGARSVLLEHLNSPFGMAVIGERLYVAHTDAIWVYPYPAGQTRIDDPGTKVVDLPAGPINHHWTKNIIASADGAKLYATVGSNSNVAENGIEAEAGRAAIWEIDLASGRKRLFATGLRNPNGMAWIGGESGSAQTLWAVVNERDELGSDLVPDYLSAVHDGAFYGWPYSWYGQHVDERAMPPRPDLVATARVPDYALGAHVAALGLAASAGSALSAAIGAGTVAQPGQGVFIGLHGSWNRRPRAGYKVIFVPFVDGQPRGSPIDVLTGFVSPEGEAWGRPVGVAIDRRGALLVADDVGNTVWRVTAR
jgi:glucose/arabinose dehydrogenase